MQHSSECTIYKHEQFILSKFYNHTYYDYIKIKLKTSKINYSLNKRVD